LVYPAACSPGIVPARTLTCTFARHAGNGSVEWLQLERAVARDLRAAAGPVTACLAGDPPP